MADGLAEHGTPPPTVMQLGSMLRREAAKDNGKQVANRYLAFSFHGLGSSQHTSRTLDNDCTIIVSKDLFNSEGHISGIF